MKLKKELLKREIAGDSFLIPMGTSVYDNNGMFLLTELGAFIWDLLPEADSIDDILHKVLEEYEVEEATAREDIAAFLKKLQDLEIL